MSHPQRSDHSPAFHTIPRARWRRLFDFAPHAILILLAGLGGAAGVLAFLGRATFDPLYGVLFLLGVSALWLLGRIRKLEEQAAQKNFDALDTQAQKQAEELTSTRAQLVTLESKLAHAEHAVPLARLPIVRGWQAAGLAEADLASQLPILQVLFLDHPEITIQKRFTDSYSARGVYLISSPGNGERVVKIARSADIRAEARAKDWISRFSQYSAGQHETLITQEEDEALGGIVYWLAQKRRAGNALLTFADFYRARDDPATILPVIEHLLREALPHSPRGNAQTSALDQDYALTASELDAAERALRNETAFVPYLSAITRAEEYVEVADTNERVRLRNPLHWVENSLPRFCARPFSITRGVIHGDLHSGNILIEEPGALVWLIDFCKSRPDGHILKDFAKLEADIKFYLLEGEEGAHGVARMLVFERALLSSLTDANLKDALGDLPAPYQKAAACIQPIRHAVAEMEMPRTSEGAWHLHLDFSSERAAPYALASFHAALRMMTYAQLKPAQRGHAFLAAALLCEQLEMLQT